MRRLGFFRRGAIVASIASVALVLSACSGNSDDSGSGDGGGEGGKPVVGVVFDVGGRGDKSFNDSAAAGVDKAVEELGLEKPVELSGKPDEPDSDKEDRIRQIVDNGADTVVVVGFANAEPLRVVAPEYPDVKFVMLDNGTIEEDNVQGVTFKDNENAFLVGAVAALASQTGTVGFVGGVNETLINNFQVGYEAGATQAKPEITVDSKYLTEAGDYSGYADPGKGKITAQGEYDAGADIVYAAAGLSNNGVFEAAAEKGKYAIGTDSDQYLTADAAVKESIIASAIKKLDVASYNFIKSVADDKFEAGNVSLGLKEDGVDYVINNEQIKSQVGAQVDDLKQQIIDGKIEVPSAGE